MSEVASVSHPGRLFDREHPTGRAVQVRVGPAGLILDLGDDSATWPYASLRQEIRPRPGEPVRLEREGSDEVLSIADARVMEAIRRAAPETATQVRGPSGLSVPAIAVIVVIALAIGALGLFWFGIPAIANSVAERLPVSWETQVGDTMLEQLAPSALRITDPAVVQPVESIVARLAQAAPSPYGYRVVVVDRPEVNAFAAPGGRIAVFRGMLGFAKTPEELAGVLAHEMEHVRRRHVTAGILKDSSLGILIGLLFGDVPGAGGFGLEMAKQLGRLSYSRAAELEADQGGLEAMIGAGIDPAAMPSLFARMAGERKDLRWADFLASHPASETRAAKLRALIGERRVAARPLLAAGEWDALKARAARDSSAKGAIHP